MASDRGCGAAWVLSGPPTAGAVCPSLSRHQSLVRTPRRSIRPLVKVSLEPKIQPEEAAAPARPTGQTAPLCGSDSVEVGDPLPQCQGQGAPRFAWRL
eukprot:15455314-Alexandrium_andersonii.AAC.1